MMIPSRRYQEGLEIASMDSHVEWGDSPENKVIKRYFVKAVQDCAGRWLMTAFIEVEIVAIADNGEDEGYLEPAVEVGCFSFPSSASVRKSLLREWRMNPPFYRA